VSQVREKSGPVQLTNAPKTPPTTVSAHACTKSGGGQFVWLILQSVWPQVGVTPVKTVKSMNTVIGMILLMLKG